MQVDATEIAARAAELEGRRPEEILALALTRYRPRIGMSTAFGAEGCALIAMLARLDRTVPIVYIDTGYAFRETNELKVRLELAYGITVQVLEPKLTIDEQAELHGPKLYARDPDACCAIRKVEPMERALLGLDSWITGRRREQAKTRTALPVLEVVAGPEGDVVKVNPLAAWTKRELWTWLVDEKVPYNPLHDRGYPSIGCWPCTRAVADGEDERAGRWAGTGKTECGIHTFLQVKKA